jgi:hypothetical protein
MTATSYEIAALPDDHIAEAIAIYHRLSDLTPEEEVTLTLLENEQCFRDTDLALELDELVEKWDTYTQHPARAVRGFRNRTTRRATAH